MDTPRSVSAFLAIAIAAGCAVGVAGSLFHQLSDALLHLNVDAAQDWPLAVSVAASAAFSAVLVTVAYVLVRRFAPETAGSGVHEIEGAIEGLRVVRWHRVLPVKFVGGIMSIGAGMTVGREGPIIHIGASVCAAFAQTFRLDDEARRSLIAAGAASGLAVAFAAPVAAVLFVMEETRRQFPYSFRSYSCVILATLAAASVSEWMARDTGPQMAIDIPEFALWHVGLFAALGGLLGLVGVLFNATLLRSLDLVERLRPRFGLAIPLVVGALVGALLVLAPHAVTGGEELIPRLIDNPGPMWALLLLVVVRFVSTMASYSVGAPGGIFAPILTLATVIGLAFAACVSAVPMLGAVDPAMCAVLAMAGLFTATVRAPMVGVVLVAEITNGYIDLLPLLACCAAAHIVAQAAGGQPIYEQLLERTLARSARTSP